MHYNEWKYWFHNDMCIYFFIFVLKDTFYGSKNDLIFNIEIYFDRNVLFVGTLRSKEKYFSYN